MLKLPLRAWIKKTRKDSKGKCAELRVELSALRDGNPNGAGLRSARSPSDSDSCISRGNSSGPPQFKPLLRVGKLNSTYWSHSTMLKPIHWKYTSKVLRISLALRFALKQPKWNNPPSHFELWLDSEEAPPLSCGPNQICVWRRPKSWGPARGRGVKDESWTGLLFPPCRASCAGAWGQDGDG